jgi:hypothetical protein
VLLVDGDIQAAVQQRTARVLAGADALLSFVH